MIINVEFAIRVISTNCRFQKYLSLLLIGTKNSFRNAIVHKDMNRDPWPHSQRCDLVDSKTLLALVFHKFKRTQKQRPQVQEESARGLFTHLK